MTPAIAAAAPRVMCHAIPAASRHGWREDVLCASTANTTVVFAGREMPVCRMHASTYLRALAADPREAMSLARDLWGWRLS